MTERPAFQRLTSNLNNGAEQLLAELQMSIDRLRHLKTPDSERLLGEVQTVIDEIRRELGKVAGPD